MELKDVVNHTLKECLKENNFKTKGSDWWRKLDVGYLMVHHRKSSFSNSCNGFDSEISIFAVTDNEMANEQVSRLWVDYQDNRSVKLRALVPELGFLTEGMSDAGFDLRLCDKNWISGKTYTVEDWVKIVHNILNTYLIPYLNKITTREEFENSKDALYAQSIAIENNTYRFYKAVLSSGMFESNISGFVSGFQSEFYLLEDVKQRSDILDRMLASCSDKFRKDHEAQIRSFVSKVIELAGKEK